MLKKEIFLSKILRGGIALSFCIGLTQWSCQEPKRGCLDSNATNFDVSAKESCLETTQNCCEYPRIQLKVAHLTNNDTTSFILFDSLNIARATYQIGTDSVRFLSCQFFFSDFQLVTTQNKIVVVPDSSLVFRQNDSVRVRSDFALIGRNNGFDYPLGSFTSFETYNRVRFQFGLNDTLAAVVPRRMPSGTPLSIRSDSMYFPEKIRGKNWVWGKIVMIHGKDFKDTTRIYLTERQNIDIAFVKNLSFKRGFDADLPLRIKYLRLFEGIRIGDTTNLARQKIVDNLAKAITIP